MAQKKSSSITARIDINDNYITLHFEVPVTTYRQKHNHSLGSIHQRRLFKLKEKEAMFGLNTPPEILMEIEDIEAKLANI
jgi:hypothetical protein